MTLETWWLYLGAVVLISCTPGPNVLYVTTRSIRFGLGSAFIGVAGCLTALVLMLTGSVAGLSAVLLALPGAFDVLKIAGAAYLVYLGIQVWREPVADEAPPPSTGTSGVALFRDGFLVGISNPKLLVFAAAFFPQFIDPARAWGPRVRADGGDVPGRRAVLLFDLCTHGAQARRPTDARCLAPLAQSHQRRGLHGLRRRPAALQALKVRRPSPR